MLAYAFPGGYPIYYVTTDNGVLCPKCAGSKECKEATADNSQWFLAGADCNYENPNLYCDHCNKRIESAYCEEENLDGMDLSDLQAYCQVETHPAPLREYAAVRARAMEARLAGRIPQALKWENACDNLYKLLPSNLQW